MRACSYCVVHRAQGVSVSVRARPQLKASESIVQPRPYNDCVTRLTSLRSPLTHAASCTSSLCWKFRTTASSWTRRASHSLRNCLIKTPLRTRSEIPSTSFKFCPLNLSAWLPAQYPEKGAQQFSAPSPFAAVKVTPCLAVIPRLLHQNGSVVSQALAAQRRDFGQ